MWFREVHSFEFHRAILAPPLSSFVIILKGPSSLKCFALLSLVPSINELGFASQVFVETQNGIQSSHLHFHQECLVMCWELIFKWFIKYWWQSYFMIVFLQLSFMDALWDNSKNYTQQMILFLTLLIGFTSKTVSLITTWFIIVPFFLLYFYPLGHIEMICVGFLASSFYKYKVLLPYPLKIFVI